jgi:hypothetical protein
MMWVSLVGMVNKDTILDLIDRKRKTDVLVDRKRRLSSSLIELNSLSIFDRLSIYNLPCILPNLLVATAARHAEQAPINKHTAIAFGPSVL